MYVCVCVCVCVHVCACVCVGGGGMCVCMYTHLCVSVISVSEFYPVHWSVCAGRCNTNSSKTCTEQDHCTCRQLFSLIPSAGVEVSL